MSDPIFESALEHMQKVEEQEEVDFIPAITAAEGLVMDLEIQDHITREVHRLEEEYGGDSVKTLLGNPDFESTLKDELSNFVAMTMADLRDSYGVEVQEAEPPVESKEVKEQEDIYVPKVGDTVQIMDLEGNTTPVPEATVYDVSEDTEGNIAVEITGSEDEDERMWYSDNEYRIILLTPAKESKEEVEEGKIPDDKDSEEVKIKKLTEEEKPAEESKLKEQTHPSDSIRQGNKVKILHGSRKGEMGEIIDITEPEPDGQFDVKMPDGKMVYLGWDDVELAESK